MARKRTRSTEGEFLADNPATPDINEAWEETPETPEAQAPEAPEAPAAPANIEQITPSEEPVAPAAAPEKETIETDVRKKLAKKTEEENPFIPQNSAQLEAAAKEVAKEKGFDLTRGTSIGARLMARRKLG